MESSGSGSDSADDWTKLTSQTFSPTTKAPDKGKGPLYQEVSAAEVGTNPRKSMLWSEAQMLIHIDNFLFKGIDQWEKRRVFSGIIR